DAFHSRADIYVLALVLASFAGELLQIRIDRWIAGIIALMIFILAVKTIVRSLFMLFRLSAGTAPEDRTVEDAVIMLTMGGLTSGLSRITGRLTAMLNLTDPVIRRRWLRRSIGGVSGLAVTAWLATGIYTVSPSDVAIEEIVGKAVNRDRPSGPGLHVTWPVPFGRVRHVDTRTVRSMRLGYQLKDRGDLILWTNAHYIIEYAVLSGDGAILDLAANLHYRVIDPAAFLYGVASPVESLEMLANQVLREMAGSREAFSLLTVDRRGQEQAVLHTIQTVADQVNLGVEILAICLLDMHPPIDVAPAYEDVVSAQEDLETFVEEARGYEKEMLPLARAEAVVKRTEAAAYGTGQILRAKGRVAAFKVRNEAFKRHESINRYRMRMDNLAVGLAGAEIVLVDPGQVQRPLDLIVTRNFAPETAPMIVSPGGAGAEGEAYREP
ncbi:protease modulator HflK, partial [bacterium]|nr:protease modulator HflK [candidate division CSSED10-310 bacterium]